MYKKNKNPFSKINKNTTKPSIHLPYVLDDTTKETILSQSYLGKKGYTIPKSCLTTEELAYLRKELMVKPFVIGPAAATPTIEEFPVFRENTNKLYIPRFYGTTRYGLPKVSEIQMGDDINIEFKKELRDYQNKIIDVYMNHVDIGSGSGGGGILEVPCGRGKTVMALKIIALIRKKTLIIVHKEFLMNQWIERIAEFLPDAKVGKIQGSVFDVEGKDIVIGMVQSLYDKEYPADAFSPFGLTIIDEVHRIGSEQFSRTLFKTITPYMLGISATVERKDKLTKILYMFIGNKIYSEERELDDLVNVRGIYYKAADSEFNETEMDFRGNPKYSSMITKLCEFGPRSDFIIRVIKDLIEEDDEKQMMILCHNRSLLSYLHKAIEYRKIATVGFYVGGMKQVKLQETETKQIVLATYAMAAEALDIKSLSTLIMVTPKTDITQSVGRILRVKHDNPIIVDIIDSHDIFQNQWHQRRRFYKRCNYQIHTIDSQSYQGMMDISSDGWKCIYKPDRNSPACKDDDSDEPDQKPVKKCLINMSMLDLS